MNATTNRYSIEALPNGLYLVTDRYDGLRGLFNADGSKRSGDIVLRSIRTIIGK